MQRLESLDSLRGIAALTVVLSHLFMVFPQAVLPIDLANPTVWADPVTWLRYSPLRTFVGGRPAVILFFVLSGFVLAMAFSGGRGRLSYSSYAWKRFCRIYLPFAASILLAAVLLTLTGHAPVPGLSLWFTDKSWTEPASGSVVGLHLLMTGIDDQMMLNNVMWSLVHEMRISLAFPLLMLVVDRGTRATLGVFGAIFVFATLAGRVLPAETLAASLVATLRYSAYFALGALMARRREGIARRMGALSSPVLGLGLGATFCVLAIPTGVPVAEPLYGVGAAFLIAAAIGAPRLRRVLEGGVLTWLGRVSFSLYLVHLQVLLVAFHLLYGEVPTALIVLLVLVLSLLLAEIAHRTIEVPAMKLGRRLPATA